MSSVLEVNYEGRPCYQIHLTDSFGELIKDLQACGVTKERRLCIITDSNVAAFHLQAVEELLQKEYDTVTHFIFPAGEEHKNLETVQDAYTHLIESHFDRKDVLLALGGGVVGDLTGFTAATYMRGIDFVQIPTSLLSQVDSSIGGKTGVDFRAFKNMVGAFYMPKLVYMNLKVLDTLPREQFISGMGEIVKHGLIRDRAYFDWLLANRDRIEALDMEALEHMIAVSCGIKRAVVENDPKEKGERALLNFGHTIGHAVEKCADFQLFHGQCVGIGMAAAAYISKNRGKLSESGFQAVLTALQAFSLPMTALSQESLEDVYRATRSDKKMDGSKVKFILLSDIGDAYIERDLSEDEIKDGIRFILKR